MLVASPIMLMEAASGFAIKCRKYIWLSIISGQLILIKSIPLMFANVQAVNYNPYNFKSSSKFFYLRDDKWFKHTFL